MNYFQLFNKVMLELNLKPLTDFENITKNEHLRILENLKRVNLEVCSTFRWNFLVKRLVLDLPAGENTVVIEGMKKVEAVFVSGALFKVCKNYEMNNRKFNATNEFALLGNNKIILPKVAKSRRVTVLYETSNFALTKNDTPIENFTSEFDRSILPSPYADDILIYGASVLTKANPSFAKFAFWETRYKIALKRLVLNCTLDGTDEPEININRVKCAYELKF